MDAVIESTSFSVIFSRTYTSVTVGFPSVNVPVLSKAIAFTEARRSKCMPPLKRIPFLAPLEIADNVAGVMAATSAQGDATTSKIIAR